MCGEEDVADVAVPPAAELEAVPKAQALAEASLRMVALELIDRSPFQIGSSRGDPEADGEVKELAESIRASGLAEPMVVRPASGGRYELIAGHRRLAACRLAGLSAERCVVRDIDDAAAEDLHVVENLQRKDLTAIEEAQSVRRMLANGRTPEDVARATGKSVRWVYRRASITELTAGWMDAAGRYALSAAFLERVGRLPGDVQAEVLAAMSADEALFTRGGDVAVLDEEIEVSLRKLSGAPWAHLPGDPAKCAGCPDRSDARPDLFEEMAGEPRCLNKHCWDKKVDGWVSAAKAQAKKAYGEVIEARANSAHLYKAEADGKYSVPVIITDGAQRGRVMWAPNKDAAAEQTGKPKKALSAKDLEKAAYVRAVHACVSGAQVPDWGDGAPAIPSDVIAAFALGCGVNAYQIVSGAYDPLQKSLAILEKIAGGLPEETALWKAARPNIVKHLDIEALGVTHAACEMLEGVARKVAAALLIPDAMIEGFVAEFAPKKGRGKKQQ